MIAPVFNLASGYIQSLFTGAPNGSSSTNIASTSGAAGNTQDPNKPSPFAQILSSLQQLEQSSAPQYRQVTQQVATNLSTASQSAAVAGSPGLASELTQLSTDFRNASASGQLPNVRDLAQAIGSGAGRYHQIGRPFSSSAPSGSGSNLNEFLQSLGASQNGSSANGSLNALSIIDNTLSSAGIL
jgi:hypothetical protein